MGNVTVAYDTMPQGLAPVGLRKMRTGTITMSSSYATDGDSIVAGFTTFGFVQKPDLVIIECKTGYALVWDSANDKIIAYASGGTQVANTTNLAAVAAKFIALGR